MCIDHHPSNSGYADCMLLDGDAAATAEIIYELLTAIGTEITPTIADCLYTGLSTDTGCFKFANTTARTHEIAAKLITCLLYTSLAMLEKERGLPADYLLEKIKNAIVIAVKKDYEVERCV